MKKTLSLFAVVLCCAATAWAEAVSPAAARAAAARFLQSQGTSIAGEEAATPRGGRTAASDSTPAYYVFNADAAKGFVVVSGDDCVGGNLVLGYTTQGNFSADNVPDNLQWWLDATAENITSLSAQGRTAARVVTHDDIAPLVTSMWDQGSPYNGLCPKVSGTYPATGCMATALAQVLRYHRWPQAATGTLPAYSMVGGTVVDALPATTFDWDNMLDNYDNGSNDDQKYAVAELMRYCGQSVQMDYSPSESNGVCYDLDLLVNSFGYDPGVYSAKADNYTVSGWDALIYKELQEGRPLVYAGRSTGGGHAFVIDGYEVNDGEGYYSVNWGWSGTANGYYKINLLNATASGSGGSSTKDGYSRGQQALIGLQPRTGSAKFYRSLDAWNWNLTTDNGPAFLMVNQSYKETAFNIAIVGRNSDGTPNYNDVVINDVLTVPGFSNAAILSGYMTGILGITFTEDFCQAVFSGRAPGRHNYMFISKESVTGATWEPVFGPNSYIEVVIGSTGQLQQMIVHPNPQLSSSPDEIKLEGLKQRGLAQSVTATVHNASSDDYIGSVNIDMYLVADGVLYGPAVQTQTGIMIKGKGQTEVCSSVSAPRAGDYVVLMTTSDGVNAAGVPLSHIENVPNYLAHTCATFDELDFACLDIAYEERTDEHDKTIYCVDVAVGNGTPMDYDAACPINVYKRTDSGEYIQVNFPSMPYSKIQVPSETWCAFTIELPQPLEKGDYMVELLMANDFHSLTLSSYFVFAVVPLSVTETGVETVEEFKVQGGQDGEWYDINGRKLDDKPARKGFYVNGGKKFFVE